MFLIVKFFNSSKFKILSIFLSIFVLHAFGCIMSIEDLTFRLPRDVRPISYVLQLYPDFNTNIFTGEVIIAVAITCQCRFIAIHAKDLTIENTRISALKQVGNNQIVIGDLILNKISIIEAYDMIILETRRIILPGMYEIQIKFNGMMANDNRGIFMTSYIDPDTGLTRKIASTHFQPTNARRAFPCFDEPGFKAIFNIRLIQPNIDGYHSLSNTPSEFSIPGVPLPGLTTVYFKPTSPIQTYLVTFVISDLRNMTAYIPNLRDNSRKTLIQAWTTEDNIIRTDLVLHITYQAIDYYNHIFGLDYPLSKIDLIAVPRFFRDSDENRGLAIFDERSMLFFDRANSVTDLKIIANKITNRIVRIWFANLVTMEWWSDYWLIESFALYMQYYTNDYIFSDWKENENFVIDAKYSAMTKDTLISTQPIFQLFENPEKLPYLFNDMSVKKGASIIRMLHHMMGEIPFFHGVALYLQLYQNHTTITDDFVNCLQVHYPRDENLVRFVRTWIDQSGFPVLNVVRIGNTYHINQTIFSISNVTRVPGISPYSSKWDLPIFYITNLSNWPKRIFMSYNNEEVQLIVDDQIRWVKFNSNSIGYYTVNYDRRSWNTLSMVLRTQPQKFGVLDRIDLLNDAFINADAGSVPYNLPLGMLSYMKFETEYTPWKMACDKILMIHAMLRATGALRKFEDFVRIFIKPIYELIGWDIHDMDSFEIRFLSHRQVFEIVSYLLLNLSEVTRSIHCTFKFLPEGMVYAGDYRYWNTMYNVFIIEEDLQERHKLMYSLTAVQNTSLLMSYLETGKDLEIVQADEYLILLEAAAANPIGPRIVWNFYRINWNFLTSRYSEDDRDFARLIIPVGSKFRTVWRLDELQNFFGMNPYGTLSTEARNEVVDIVKNSALWLQRNYNEIKDWLDKNEARQINFANTFLKM